MGELRRELAAARAPRDDAPPPPPLRNPQLAELQREVERLTDEAESRRATSFVEATRLRDEADAARAVASDLRDDLRAAEGQRDEAVDAARKLERTVARLKGDVDAAAGRRDAADARALHEAAAAPESAGRRAPARGGAPHRGGREPARDELRRGDAAAGRGRRGARRRLGPAGRPPRG